MKKINLFFVALVVALVSSAQTTSTFDDLTLGPDTAWTGSTFAGGFSDGNAYFENQYDTTGGYISWGGFVYSDKTDTTTAGYGNQYSAITGSGYAGSHNYAVAYDEGDGNVRLRLTGSAKGRTVGGFYVTNTTYAYRDMLNGDPFDTAAFNVDSNDFLLLSITGWNAGTPINDTVNFFLANYSDSNGVTPYIVNTWQWVSLLELGNVDSLVFSISGSRNDSYGLLTPAYFAMDNFVTANLPAIDISLLYTQDTLINILADVGDTTNGPYTVHFVSNTIYGASVAVDSANMIFYVPQQGVVGFDTVFYAICNASNVCDTAIIVFDCESPAGITAINTLQAKVYPNPCGNSFSVYHSSDVKTIDLLDMQGRLIREINCTNGELITGIRTDDLQAGMYMVKVMSDDAVGVAKITKQ